jgi:DNA-binding transcriptional MocR family regulator
LSEIDRDSSTSLTQQLVDLFARRIDAGELEPGEKLLPTRELAAAAGVNHLTAARVYRRLAELGYVTASVGRGTFVRTVPPLPADVEEADDWQAAVLPEPSTSLAARTLEEAMRLLGDPSMIALGAGVPAPEFVPVDEFARITAEVYEQEGSTLAGYLKPEGLPALREAIAAAGREAGFAQEADEIIVVSGARQGLDLTARAVLRPGDAAVVESPTFTGLLSSLQETGARVISVGVDEDGFDVDALERVLARHEVKLVALQSACHNPTGHDLSAERAVRLLALARERSFFILEDAVYASVRYEGPKRSRLRAAAPAHVIYVDSLSKTVGAGLRLGWIAASGPVRGRLATLKVAADMGTPTLMQHVIARYLSSGGHARHLKRVLPAYRERRDVMCDALERHLGEELSYIRPRGGHHVWVTLRRPMDERVLQFEAVRAGVAFTPGSAMTVEPPSRTALRLSFSRCGPDELEEGVRRLATALRAVRRADPRAAPAPPP